jgi:hypothetical protein
LANILDGKSYTRKEKDEQNKDVKPSTATNKLDCKVKQIVSFASRQKRKPGL